MADLKLETVLVEKRDGVAWVTFNRPDKRNAMSPQFHFDMGTVLDELEFDEDARVLVLTGAGDAWCAGQDLELFFRDLEDKPKLRAKTYAASQYWRWHKLFTYPKPTIAMVNGHCFGGAFTQLIACDFAITDEEARFGLSEVNWGIIPGGFVSRALNECLSLRDIARYALLGEPFDGREAARSGLVTWAVPGAELRSRTEAMAAKLAKLNPETVRATKQAIKNVRNMDDVAAFDYLSAKSAELTLFDREDGYRQGLTQFIDEKSYKPGLQPYRRPAAA